MGTKDVEYLTPGDLVWVTAESSYGWWRRIGVQVKVESTLTDHSGACCEFGKTIKPMNGEDGSAFDFRVFRANEMRFTKPSMCDSYQYFDGKVEKNNTQ